MAVSKGEDGGVGEIKPDMMFFKDHDILLEGLVCGKDGRGRTVGEYLIGEHPAGDEEAQNFAEPGVALKGVSKWLS